MKDKFFIVILALFSLNVFAQTSAGTSTIQLTDPQKIADLLDDTTSSTSGASQKPSAPPPSSITIQTFETFGALRDSTLPSWLKEEILSDYNLTTADLVGDILNQQIPNNEGVILDVINAPRSSNSSNKPSGVVLQKGCGGYWYAKKETFNKNIEDKNHTGPTHIVKDDTGDAKYHLDANIPTVTGTIVGELGYSKRKNACLFNTTYRVRVDYLKVDINYTTGGKFDLNGQVYYAKQQTLWSDHYELFSYEVDFWIWLVEFQAKLNLNLDANISLNTKIVGDFDISSTHEGKSHLLYQCDGKFNCTSTNQTTITGLHSENNQQSWSTTVDISVVPKFDTNLSAQLNLYYGLARVEKLKAGAVLEFPIRYYGYNGNTCGDANGDKNIETVNASLTDISMEAWGYMTYGGLFKGIADVEFNLPVGQSAIMKKQKNIPGVKDPKEVFVQSRSLYFKDTGAIINSVFDPVAVMDTKANKLTLSKRSCYPFSEPINYDVVWNDSTPESFITSKNADTSVELTHTFNGSYIPVQVKMTGDQAGRSFTHQDWLYPLPSGGGVSFNAWMIPVITSLLL